MIIKVTDSLLTRQKSILLSLAGSIIDDIRRKQINDITTNAAAITGITKASNGF